MNSSNRRRILLTGATGFVGRFLVPLLQKQGYDVHVLLREKQAVQTLSYSGAIPAYTIIGNLACLEETDSTLIKAFEQADYVIHCAGLAHAFDKADDEPYQKTNTQSTRILSRLAAQQGVRRFILVSSVRAQCGPVSSKILTESDPFAPTDAYGRSKRDAELFLEQEFQQSNMDWVALRPVLIYGTQVKGNMSSLVRLAQTPFPLPLAGFSGKRSILSLENLGEAILTLLNTDLMLRCPLLVADDDPLTIGEMVSALRKGMHRKDLLINIPEQFFGIVARFFGKQEAFLRISGSLQVDTHALKALGWKPLHSSQKGLEALGRMLLSGS